MLTDIQLLVLATTDPAVQRVVAASRRPELLSVLATSPHLDPSVADQLATHSDLSISQPALFRCQDPEVLVRGANSGVLRARWAFRNPNMPESVLTSDLHADNDPALLARCINPSTPLDYRQAVLTPDVAQRLVDVGGSLAEGVVRGFELALANPWMAATPERWYKHIKRGLAGSPDVTTTQYAALTKGRTPWPAKQAHPVVTGIDLEQAPIKELVLLANPAVDLHLIGRPDLTEDLASRMVVHRGKYAVEPHILGRLVARFGVGVLCEITEPGNSGYMSGSRTLAACYTHPAAGHSFHVHWHEWAEVLEALPILGTNQHAWEVAIGLSGSWHLGPIKLAEAAARLTKAA